MNPMAATRFNTRWLQIVVLIIIAYEALGGLAGGFLLMLAPDGHYMKMPVELMNGVFKDFFIPGLILTLMGAFSAFAFIATLRRKNSDWLISGIALSGWIIWFMTEIVIIQELHWLHIMWGTPVLLGFIAWIPLMAKQNNTQELMQCLLFCGITASLWYAFMNIYVPHFYAGYDSSSYTVSELSAIGTPTRILWVLLGIAYTLLTAAFGWGLLMYANRPSRLRTAAVFILLYGFLNCFWPPMHTREALAAGMDSVTDTLHIIWTFTAVILFMLIMGFGAAALDKLFRVYTVISVLLLGLFGGLTSSLTSAMEANLPTPMMGFYERINIGIFLLWMIVFSIKLLRMEKENRISYV